MDHDESPIRLDRSGDHVVLVRLNRPDRLNAVTLHLYRHLTDHLERIAGDPTVRAVLITGEGRAFSVGADLKAHGEAELTAEDKQRYVETGQNAYRLIQRLPQPVVAAVNGHAIGAGIELALSCDIIVIAEEAKLRLPEIGLGTFVGGGTIYTLADRVGLGRARELVLLGDFFTPAQALEWGLAHRVVPSAQVVPTAVSIAERLAEKAPLSMRLAKELLRGVHGWSRDDALDREADALLRCMASNDWQEGVQAFNEKRTPRFEGR